MPQEPHQRIILQIARSTLKPAGLVQKGKSRLWYDDRSWFATCVEFQPVSGRKASFLNVGVTWLWHPKDYWSYDIGGRMGDLVEYNNDATFSSEFSRLANSALQRTLDIRASVTTPKDAYTLIEQDRNTDDGWRNYHMGIAAGLSQDAEVAKQHLSRAIEADSAVEWMKQRNNSAVGLLESLHVDGAFTKLIEVKVAQARRLLKLPTWPESDLEAWEKR